MTVSGLSKLPAAIRMLDTFGERYALVGGLAVVLRSRARLTSDIDVVVAVPEGRLDDLLKCAADAGFLWDADEVRDFAPGGLIRVWGPPDRISGVGVDLLFADDDLSRSLLQRATLVEVSGVTLPVATPEDLILMKLDANRPTDLDDVIALRDAHGSTLDRTYLAAWATRMELTERLAAFVGLKG